MKTPVQAFHKPEICFWAKIHLEWQFLWKLFNIWHRLNISFQTLPMMKDERWFHASPNGVWLTQFVWSRSSWDQPFWKRSFVSSLSHIPIIISTWKDYTQFFARFLLVTVFDFDVVTVYSWFCVCAHIPQWNCFKLFEIVNFINIFVRFVSNRLCHRWMNLIFNIESKWKPSPFCAWLTNSLFTHSLSRIKIFPNYNNNLNIFELIVIRNVITR